MELAYKETPQSSKLRQWPVDQFLYHSSNGHFKTTADEWVSVLHGPYNIERDIVDTLMVSGAAVTNAPCLNYDKYVQVLKNDSRANGSSALPYITNVSNHNPSGSGDVAGRTIASNPSMRHFGQFPNFHTPLSNSKRSAFDYCPQDDADNFRSAGLPSRLPVSNSDN